MNNKQMIDLGHGSMCTDAMGIFLYNTYNCSLSMIKASINIGHKKHTLGDAFTYYVNIESCP